MSYRAGLIAILERLGWTRADFARVCGYKSERSVEKFFQGATPTASTLNLLDVYLEKHKAKTRKR